MWLGQSSMYWRDVDGPAVKSGQFYDPSANAWTATKSSRHAAGGAGSAIYNGMVYCFGGSTKDVGGKIVRDCTILTRRESPILTRCP